MHRIILLRHAKSSWSDPTLSDFDRPLAPRGERASKLIAEYLSRNGINPTLVLCSPSVRTRQTLAAIEPSLGEGVAVEFADELYSAPDTVLDRLRLLPESVDSVMLIGHNPGLQELACALAAQGSDLPRLKEKFPTGALATLLVRSDGWSALGPGEAELVDYVVPRELG
jgi:phosphohistidine phosphatase